VDVSVASGAQSAFDLAPLLLTENFDLTVVRTIIQLDLTEGVTAAIVGIQAMHLGIGIASQEAFSAGNLPLPATPAADPASGWLWKASRLVQGTQTLNSYRIVHLEYDISAQRKLGKGTLYIIIENNVFDGTAQAIRVHGEVRTLYKR